MNEKEYVRLCESLKVAPFHVLDKCRWMLSNGLRYNIDAAALEHWMDETYSYHGHHKNKPKSLKGKIELIYGEDIAERVEQAL